ncbi:CIA30 family protein [Flavobacterium sp. UBA7663]|uniref:CIA30 family protein n=1 Tax=Flavobacterium sp. UBA7663 TaxID=1946557 RepID=UPI0025BE6557|nr:CIA30 family protein [Flavobacterium sp. UBA7663]
MKTLFILLTLSIMSTSMIYDFNKESLKTDWIIEDDGAMDGIPLGKFSIDKDGNGVFSGTNSLDNNGVYSSVRRQFDKIQTNENSKILIRLKGDGNEYQFKIKDKSDVLYSYMTTFETSGKWETIEIKLSDLYPSYRGLRQQNSKNYNRDSFVEIAFFIANTEKKSFKLILDKIELK